MKAFPFYLFIYCFSILFSSFTDNRGAKTLLSLSSFFFFPLSFSNTSGRCHTQASVPLQKEMDDALRETDSFTIIKQGGGTPLKITQVWHVYEVNSVLDIRYKIWISLKKKITELVRKLYNWKTKETCLGGLKTHQRKRSTFYLFKRVFAVLTHLKRFFFIYLFFYFEQFFFNFFLKKKTIIYSQMWT